MDLNCCCVVLCCVVLGWVGLGWVGLGCVVLCCVVLGWVGLSWVVLFRRRTTGSGSLLGIGIHRISWNFLIRSGDELLQQCTQYSRATQTTGTSWGLVCDYLYGLVFVICFFILHIPSLREIRCNARSLFLRRLRRRPLQHWNRLLSA